MQKCLKDLADMGQTNLKVSEPIVSFMETIAPSSAAASVLSGHETVSLIKKLTF